jgi:hypothetical protein
MTTPRIRDLWSALLLAAAAAAFLIAGAPTREALAGAGLALAGAAVTRAVDVAQDADGSRPKLIHVGAATSTKRVGWPTWPS